MNTSTAIHFLGWFGLTYLWLTTNSLFFTAIDDAIQRHNEQIRLQTLEEIESEDEEENEDEKEE